MRNQLHRVGNPADPGDSTGPADFPAIRSHGVSTPDDNKRKRLRSELATQVIMRSIADDVPSRGLRQSALERALRQPKLRGATLDARSVPELLTAALEELRELNHTRQRGETLAWGPAMLQITLRGGFYLFFGKELALGRSPVGGKKNAGTDNREATQIIEDLGKTKAGLQLLTQAVYDGHNNVALRKLAKGAKATDIATPPSDDDKLTNDSLRAWLADAVEEDKKTRLGEDLSARHRTHSAALTVRQLTEQLEAEVDAMGTFADTVNDDAGQGADSETTVGPPYVMVHGMADSYKVASRLNSTADTLKEWNMRFELRGRGAGASA